jgi:dimethylhistidine N-methyltransferase
MTAARTRRDAATPADPAFAAAILDGLSRSPKAIPPKFFYDARGSRLFEDITALPEYYPTRTEIEILTACANEIAQHTAPGTALIEFGSGSSRKTELLLAAASASAATGFAAYVPIDVSATALHGASVRLADRFPTLPVVPVVADFTGPFTLPPRLAAAPKLGFFPGSTIGNFTPDEARALLAAWREPLGPGGRLVVGVDLEKCADVLVAAYDDAAGVTAQFNLNLLERIDRELAGTFDPALFAHAARWNVAERRIEMHLVARRAHTVRVLGREFAFEAGESIHTENSYKYTVARFKALASEAGWRARDVWMDADGRFSVHELVDT